MKAFYRAAASLGEKLLYRWRRVRMRLRLKHVGRKVMFIGVPGINYGENIAIGDETTVNHFVFLGGRGGITVGRRVRLSNHAVLETAYLDTDPANRHHLAKPIVIEDNAWIATGAIVLAGVTVGRNSIVAAGAVVNRDVPPDSVAMGVPARIRPLPSAAGGRG